MERWAVRGVMAIGVLLLAVFFTALADRYIGSASALALVEAGEPEAVPTRAAGNDEVDFALWSEKRRLAYLESLRLLSSPPLGVLAIESLRLKVPVFQGTDDLVLNRGAGWIAGTTKPGEDGNVGIAAHRDGFFRSLAAIQVGDSVVLTTPKGRRRYAVDQIQIVNPSDVSVLKPRPKPSITLVTCYPFYYIGDAPQRYIVHASLVHGQN